MYSFSLTREQADLLKLFAKAYETPDSRSGVKESIYFSTTNAGTSVWHEAFPESRERVSMGDIEELHAHGLIDIRYGHSDLDGSFRVTSAGHEAVANIEEQEQALTDSAVVPEEGTRMGLDWQTEVLPVLQAVHDLYPSAPAHKGVSQSAINERLGREPSDPHTGLVLRKLEEAGYIVGKIRASQVDGPVFCEPAAKALELLAGWPTDRGDAALAQLIAVLEKRIDETADEEEKGRLQRLLKSVREVSQGVMVAVLSDVITGG